MSDYPQNSYSGQSPQFEKQPPYGIESPTESNALGIAGFVVSIIGILTCGFLSIFAVLLSAIALMKPPRGFAIAGMVMGCAGLALLASLVVLFLSGSRALTTVVKTGVTAVQLKDAADRIGRAWESDGKLPSKEEGQRLLSNKNDLWNQPIVYETDGKAFSVRSIGMDGIANTQDDMVEGPFDSAKEAFAFEIEGHSQSGKVDRSKPKKNTPDRSDDAKEDSTSQWE